MQHQLSSFFESFNKVDLIFMKQLNLFKLAVSVNIHGTILSVHLSILLSREQIGQGSLQKIRSDLSAP